MLCTSDATTRYGQVRTVIESATCIAINVVASARPEATPAIVQTTATVPSPRLRSFGSSASRRRIGETSGSGGVSTDISNPSLSVLAFQYRQRPPECHREVTG